MTKKTADRFPDNDDHDAFWGWVEGMLFTAEEKLYQREELYERWQAGGQQAIPAHDDPEVAARWLRDFLVKWPPNGLLEEALRGNIRSVLNAFGPLNEAATKGEITPGFWGGFAARCQIKMKAVKAQTEALIAAIEADPLFAKQLHGIPEGQIPRHIQLRAQHTVAEQVLAWLDAP